MAAIENIYYLDQFTKVIYKTNSTNTNSVAIEDVSSLGGSETLVNLQLSDTHMYLFGDTALVLKRPISGGSWTTILNSTSQTALAGSGLESLNGQNSKKRSEIVTKDGNVYVVISQTYTNSRVTMLHYSETEPWSILGVFYNSKFMGLVDLNYNTNLIGLKTSDLNLDNDSQDVEQVKLNCNRLRMYQGTTLTEITAPTNVIRPAVSDAATISIQNFNYNIWYETPDSLDDLYFLQYQGTNAEIVHINIPTIVAGGVALSRQFTIPDGYTVRLTISTTHVVAIIDDSGFHSTTPYSFRTYPRDLSSVTTGTLDTNINNSRILNFVALQDGNILILSSSTLSYIFNPTTGVTTDSGHGTLYNSESRVAYTTLLDGTLVFGGGSSGPDRHIVHYVPGTGTWIQYMNVLPQESWSGKLSLVTSPGNTYDGDILLTGTAANGYTYHIYDPTSHTLVSSQSLGPSTSSTSVMNYPNIHQSSGGSYTIINFVTGTLVQNNDMLNNNTIYDGITRKSSTGIYSIRNSMGSPNRYINIWAISSNVSEMVPTIANMQAVTAISPTEVYCLTALANGLTYSQNSSIFYWDGSAWTILYDILDHSMDFEAIEYWGEGQGGTWMSYTPLLMASRYLNDSLELLMMRDSLSSVTKYNHATQTFTGSILLNNPDDGYEFNGVGAPSVPFEYSNMLTASVTIGASDPTYPAPGTFRNDMRVYAEARLFFKNDLQLYCLIRNSEIYFSTEIYDYTAIPNTKVNSSFYLGPIPIQTDSAVPMVARLTSVDSNLTVTVQDMNTTGVSMKVDVGVSAPVSTAMPFTLDVAPGGSFTSTANATHTFNILVPPVPTSKNTPIQSYYLSRQGSSVFASGDGVCSTTDGLTWVIEDTYTNPLINVNNLFTGWSPATHLGICENAPAPIAFGEYGIQRKNGYWQQIPVYIGTFTVPPVPVPPLPTPFGLATPLVLTGNDVNVSGTITVLDPIYPEYNVNCDIYSFRITKPTDVSFMMTLNGTWVGTGYMTLNKLVGTDGAYTYVEINAVSSGSSLNMSLDPGTYYVLPQSGMTGDVGAYTLTGTIIPKVIEYPNIWKMVYDGQRYIAILSFGGSQYVNVVGVSTDLSSWHLLNDQFNTYVGNGYYAYCDLHTANGTTIACLGDRMVKIDSTGAYLIPSGYTVNSVSSYITADGAGTWLAYNMWDGLFKSVDDGDTWVNIDSLYNADRAGHGLTAWGATTALAYVNGDFVIVFEGSSNVDMRVLVVPNLNFVGTTLSKIPGNLASSSFSKFATLGTKLITVYNGTTAYVSADSGLSWGIPVILSFTRNPTTISVGGSSTLSWSTADTETASINQGVGSVALSGTTSVSPVTTTTYTLTGSAAGATSATQTVTVTVVAAPTIVLFDSVYSTSNMTVYTHASQNAYDFDSNGTPVTLRYNTTNTVSAVVTDYLGATKPLSASGAYQLVNVYPPAVNPATYTLTATNSIGTQVTATVNITVHSPIGPWGSIAYGASKFVAMGSNKFITSSNGDVPWTLVTGSTLAIRTVRFINGIFIAVGTNVIYHSTDGTTWVASTTVPVGDYYSVTYGAGTYVAVGNSVCVTSTDAVTWTSKTIEAKSWVDVAYGDSQFVAVSTGYGAPTNSISTSTNGGVTWTSSQPAGANTGFDTICYGAGKFVAIGQSYDGETPSTMTRPDGGSWTAVAAAQPYIYKRVFFDGTYFVRVGSNILQRSSNGTSWTTYATGPSWMTVFNDVAYDGIRYIAVYTNTSCILT